MKNSKKRNRGQLFATHSSEEYQQEYRLQSQYQNINHNDRQEFKTIKKVIVPIIFIMLLSLICIFSYNFMAKLRDNRQIMMNIILSEQKNSQIFQEEINSLVELKQEVLKNTYTTDGKQKEGTQLIHKLQGKLKQFDQKIDKLQSRLERLSAKTSEKEDVAKLAIIQANQIKKQLKLVHNNILKENPNIKSQRDNQSDQIIKSLFTIPKNIWIFSSEYPNYLRKKYIDNIRFYGNLGGFTVQLLNFQSANQLLSKESFDDLKQVMKLVRSNNQLKSKQQINTLQIKLILLNFLNEYGGIAMDGNLAMTEDIKWIQSILQNKFVKQHQRSIIPQIVSFYRPEKPSPNVNSSKILPAQIEDMKNNLFNYPAIEYFFLAAGRDTLFLPSFIKTIYTILHNIYEGNNIPQISKVKNDEDRQFYKQIFDLAYHQLLKQKQIQLDSQSQQNQQTAYDFYGLNAINGYYGPLKMQLIYELQPKTTNHDEFSHRIYDQLAHTAMDDYISLYGPIKYLFRLPFEDNMDHYLEGSIKSIDIVIYEDSIIQKIFFPEKPKVTYIKKNPFFSFIQPEAKLWETLPKIIWVFQSDKPSLFIKLCMERMQQMGKESLFEIRKVNENTLKDYLQSNLIDQIQAAMKSITSQQKQIISYQLYKLAILQKHGGVFINAATLAVQNFDWILKISNMPTQFIYNCFESHPKILMIWDPLSSQPQSWDLKQLDNFKAVKSQWNQPISDSFIATEANNELIKEWFRTLKELLKFSTIQLTNIFKDYGLDKYGVTGSPSTLSKDTLRYTLAKRQKQIQEDSPLTTQNSAGYYKLWTLNAFSSYYKLKSSINYQNPDSDLNPYIFAYSQDYVQAIVGKIRYILTFSQSEVVEIDKILVAYSKDDRKPIDPNSILQKTFHLSPLKLQERNNMNSSIQIDF